MTKNVNREVKTRVVVVVVVHLMQTEHAYLNEGVERNQHTHMSKQLITFSLKNLMKLKISKNLIKWN